MSIADPVGNVIGHLTATKKLRQHQNEAVKALLKKNKAQLVLPTGTGKSLIMGDLILKLIARDGVGVHVVVAPRILLAWQHVGVLANWLLKTHKKQVQFLNVNSGELSSKIKARVDRIIAGMKEAGLYTKDVGATSVDTTTSPEEIRKCVNYHRKNKCSLIICSTYHSAKQILVSKCQIDSYHYDEAQYLVTEGDFKDIAKYPSTYKYSYTATQKLTNSNEGAGMNNENTFGPVGYTKSPKQMIEAGEMVKPAIQLTNVRGNYNQSVDASNDYKSIWDSIVSAFMIHKDRIKADSADPDRIGAKMMVICEGQKQLMGLPETPEFKAYIQSHPNVGIFIISSEHGAYMRSPGMLVATYYKPLNPHTGGVSTAAKEAFLQRVSPPNIEEPYELALRDEDDAIIIHVDMLAEGLDVPGITGIMPFRNLGRIKFLQNLGRAARLHHIDRERLYSGEIKPHEKSKMIKPFSWVILPQFVDNSIDFTEEYSLILRALRTDYGFSSSDIVVVGNGNAAPVDVELPGDGLQRGIRSIDHQIYEFFHELEDHETNDKMLELRTQINTLSDNDKIRFFGSTFGKMITSK